MIECKLIYIRNWNVFLGLYLSQSILTDSQHWSTILRYDLSLPNSKQLRIQESDWFEQWERSLQRSLARTYEPHKTKQGLQQVVAPSLNINFDKSLIQEKGALKGLIPPCGKIGASMNVTLLDFYAVFEPPWSFQSDLSTSAKYKSKCDKEFQSVKRFQNLTPTADRSADS